MKKLNKVFSIIAAAVMSVSAVSAMSAPASAQWYKTSSGKYYYTDADGDMVIGWRTIDGEKYYFDDDGYMKKGWIKTSSGKQYYLRSDGKMAHDITLKINGETYTFDKNGVASLASNTSTKKSTTGTDSLDLGMSLSAFKKSDRYDEFSELDEGVYYKDGISLGGVKGIFMIMFEDKKLNSKDYIFDYSSSDLRKIRSKLEDLYGDYVYDSGYYLWLINSDKEVVALSYDSDFIQVLYMANPEEKTTTSTTSSQTVYITNSGSKYHRAGCRYLSKSCMAIDLEKAKKQGYTPCSKCF